MTATPEEIAADLRNSLAHMAHVCTAPMGLWQKHSVGVLTAADAIERQAAEITELRAEVERLRALPGWRPTHRHVKRGSTYMIVGRAELQMSFDGLVDGSEMIVYRAEDGRLWCRQADEFNDGRFEVLPPADTLSGEG